MTKATVTPIKAVMRTVAEREEHSDEFAELLGSLADLAVKARKQRTRLERIAGAGDARISQAIEHLAELEMHAQQVGAEAARVHNELQHARLI
jgi:hypothetical protein